MEKRDKFIKILHAKFLATYPDIFIKSETRDKKVYEESNGAMYSWYIFLCNKYSPFNLSPKYSQTEDEMVNSDWTCVDRFIEDFEQSEQWESFLFKNIII